MSQIVPFVEVTDMLIEYGGTDLNLCFQCGTCTGVCPWNLVRDFNVRGMVRKAMLGMEGMESEDAWMCATCGYCVANCPREVPIIDLMRSIRTMIGEAGARPNSLRSMLTSERDNGNPWMGDKEKRNDWAESEEIPLYADEKEWMLYACCTSCYEPDIQEASKALGRVLKSADVSFGNSPASVVCCGDSVREAGDSELVESLANTNIKIFNDVKAKKILTTSPHCYNAFKKDYPQFKGEFEPKHYTQLFAELLNKDKLIMNGESNRKITYHDPCYLGRHNGVYDEPRDVIKAIPGSEFIEMKNIRENAICCGGGGARMFMETEVEQRFSNLRIQEALDVGADTIATACPYCNSMFRDSIKSMNLEDKIEVLDISQLVDEVL